MPNSNHASLHSNPAVQSFELRLSDSHSGIRNPRLSQNYWFQKRRGCSESRVGHGSDLTIRPAKIHVSSRSGFFISTGFEQCCGGCNLHPVRVRTHTGHDTDTTEDDRDGDDGR